MITMMFFNITFSTAQVQTKFGLIKKNKTTTTTFKHLILAKDVLAWRVLFPL